MPFEPESFAGRFPDLARRWHRVSGYFRANTRRHGFAVGTNYAVPAPDPAVKGVRLAFFSDLHYTGTAAQDRRLADAAEMTAEYKPDYLLFGGDLAGHSNMLETSFRSLEYFREIPCVKLAVPGNWESGKQWIHPDFWSRHYQQYDFEFLDNRMYRDSRCAIYGLGELSSGRLLRPEWDSAVAARIIFSHRPDNVVAIDSWKSNARLAPLILCGHLHGGQVRIPFLGAVYRRASRYGSRFDYGRYEHSRGEQMIITSGMGECSFPFRFCCRREMVFIEFV